MLKFITISLQYNSTTIIILNNSVKADIYILRIRLIIEFNLFFFITYFKSFFMVFLNII